MEERVAFGHEEAYRETARHSFDEHRRAIEALLPWARIEHVGSTGVPGSVTKGDLDICVLVEPAGFAEADARMASRYTRNLASIHTDEFAAFTVERGAIDVGIQLVATGSMWDTFVRWRDLLRRDPALRRAYDALKRGYEGRPMDEYRAAKAAFIEESLSHHPREGRG
jgi:GrpB-like predicted nucleotidyltransferase (UPF0157 family)